MRQKRWLYVPLVICLGCALVFPLACAFQTTSLKDGGRTEGAESAESPTTATEENPSATDENAEEKSAEGADDSDGAEETDDEEEEAALEPDDWTFIVYMAADNNLESAAITDFNELEAVNIPLGINVLVLFDRAQGNDETNGNWTDTRLFEIAYDKADSTAIVSERLDCPELGLTTSATTELDMANTATLSGLLAYAGRMFPAQHYGLIMWGHGTGWRGDVSVTGDGAGQNGLMRAFAIDDYSGSYMSIADMRAGIQAGIQKMDGVSALDIIGFDTCFGICLETAYELRDCAELLMGTPALVPSTGWNYTRLFSLFLAEEQTALSFANCALEQYQSQYAGYTYASFSVVDCAQVEATAQAFNEFARGMAHVVTDSDTKKTVRSLLQDSCVTYRADSFPTDCYIDVRSFAERLGAQYPSVSGAANAVVSATERAIPVHWQKSDATDACGMGVFYVAYQASGIASFSHDALYVHGSRQTGQCQFVQDCTDYVPSVTKDVSLLDALFYTIF